MAVWIVDIEKRLTNIKTFTVEAEDIWAAQEKAMKNAIQFNWTEPDHEKMAILFVGES